MKVFYIFFLALFSIQALGADIAVSSYPWQKTSITEMLAEFKKIGVKKASMFQNIKIGGNGPNKNVIFHYKMPKASRDEAKKIFDNAGVQIISIGHISLSEESEIKKLFEFAKFFGVKYMTVEAPKSALEIYDKLSEKYGISAGLYNHPNKKNNPPPYSTPEKMIDALRGKKNLGAFPDCGHWGRSGFDIVSCLKKLEGKLVGINIQDLSESRECETYGRGTLPLESFISELERSGFDGLCVVMFDAAKDRSQIDKIPESVEYLTKRGFKK